MTVAALVMNCCAKLGIRDPAEFHALPVSVQDLWMEHAKNEFTGAYLTKKGE